MIAAFNATVGTPVDSNRRALERPRVRQIHSDREGKLMSHMFKAFCASEQVHHTTSPPHDHDLNPISERAIGAISETAAAIRLDAGASPRLWPHIISHAVNWHNSTIGSVGSSTNDSNISPHQRLTLRPPHVMDLASFMCRAVVLKPKEKQHKPSLAGRGWTGHFLGRSIHPTNSKGTYDVLVGNIVGGKIVQSSSVLVDEEHFDLSPPELRHRPLTSSSHAPRLPQHQPLNPELPSASSVSSSPGLFASELRALSLFSGPYARSDGLSSYLRTYGWSVDQIDNDGERGGGWQHDLLNDATYADVLAKANSGRYDAVMIAFPCSTFSIARFFDASKDGSDSGPPPVRDRDNPDGLPSDQLDPRHERELRYANLLLERTVAVAIAARRSSKRSTIVFENPADRSIEGRACYAPEFKMHGAVFATSAFKKLVAAADLSSSATFAYCRLESPYQKYTSLYYTPEAGSVLDALDGPDYKCNHEPGTHSMRAGGRSADGSFLSGAAAAYPAKLNSLLARAFTVARTGSLPPRIAPPAAPAPHSFSASVSSDPLAAAAEGSGSWWRGSIFGETSSSGGATSTPGGARLPPATDRPPPRSLATGSSPVRQFPTLAAVPAPPPPAARLPRALAELAPKGDQQPHGLAQHDPALNPTDAPRISRSSAAAAASRLAPVPEASSPPEASPPQASDGLHTPEGGFPFGVRVAASMEAAAAALAFDSVHGGCDSAADVTVTPITPWLAAPSARPPTSKGKAPSKGKKTRSRQVAFLVALADGGQPTAADMESLHLALRADSPDAPSNHAEAERRGEIWIKAEGKELSNHKSNSSWKCVPRSSVPADRRIHKMIWVYKVKRDGTAKARLCVQGSSLEEGIDYDQVFSAALRYSSARALFAYAAQNGCKVRSIDLVAAYLQGKFVDGEVVYCHLPPGYPEFGPDGRPLIARVEKPIYGIQQAGRRLQRLLFAWLRDQGFQALDDSDPCVFVRECADGEILKIGVYVDNLQICHSAELDAEGKGPKGCYYNEFVAKLSADWDVVDEGPMEDLLGIEIDYLEDGSIKLHQTKYVQKLVERFLPDGPLPHVQKNSMPYSGKFSERIIDALSLEPGAHPSLLTDFQERVGCLMYAAGSSRPDIAYPVHQLCKCLQKPTPELILETDHLFSYLARLPSAGLTYEPKHADLRGYADASWETRNSTSGWCIDWGSAVISWGSRKQKCVALSTCEAEIIALSEAAKDMVYLRKLVAGITGTLAKVPSLLFSDSKSARDVSYNPEHHDKMKHVARRHFFVRDMVESFELEVPYVPTNDNPADFFTKPMANATKFHDFRRQVMNEFHPVSSA